MCCVLCAVCCVLCVVCCVLTLPPPLLPLLQPDRKFFLQALDQRDAEIWYNKIIRTIVKFREESRRYVYCLVLSCSEEY